MFNYDFIKIILDLIIKGNCINRRNKWKLIKGKIYHGRLKKVEKIIHI